MCKGYFPNGNVDFISFINRNDCMRENSIIHNQTDFFWSLTLVSSLFLEFIILFNVKQFTDHLSIVRHVSKELTYYLIKSSNKSWKNILLYLRTLYYPTLFLKP